jgi:hypothetical protein
LQVRNVQLQEEKQRVYAICERKRNYEEYHALMARVKPEIERNEIRIAELKEKKPQVNARYTDQNFILQKRDQLRRIEITFDGLRFFYPDLAAKYL